jgi:hypothetical protein
VREHLVAELELELDLATAGQGTLYLNDDSNTPGVNLDLEQHEAPPIAGAGQMTAPYYGTTSREFTTASCVALGFPFSRLFATVDPPNITCSSTCR